MRYESIADLVAEKYESELIVEAGPLVFALGAAGAFAANNIIKKYFGGDLPDWMENMSKEWWWAALSIFDPTGIMAYPYVQEAWKDKEADPDSQWANIKFVLAFLATIPGTQIKFTSIIKLVTGAPILKRIFTYLFSGVGKAVNNTSVTNRIIPTWVAQSSGKMFNGKDQALIMRESIEKSMGIKISDEAIEEAAKKLGIELKTPGLISRVGGGASRVVSGAGRAVTGAVTRAGANAAKLGTALLKGAGRGGTLATGLMGAGGLLGNGKSLGGPRTSPVMGPKVQFGYAGGVVK